MQGETRTSVLCGNSVRSKNIPRINRSLYTSDMQSFVASSQAFLEQLCIKHGVARLFLIGSAARDDFDPQRSDLDFVVEFQSLATNNAADRFFGLLADLEDHFSRPIDLISYSAVRNPYLKQVIDRTRIPLYAA
jgi:uncharacterized protein